MESLKTYAVSNRVSCQHITQLPCSAMCFPALPYPALCRPTAFVVTYPGFDSRSVINFAPDKA